MRAPLLRGVGLCSRDADEQQPAEEGGHFVIRLASSAHLDNQNASKKIRHTRPAESSRRDTSKSEVFSVLGALACTHDLLKVRPKCHYGVFFAQNFSLAKVITLANLTMHMYEVWPAVTPK